MRHCGKHHVILEDGTCWAVDRETPEGEYSLEWVLRYGSPDRIVAARMTLASILGSYTALLNQTQKRRNRVAKELCAALAAWPSPEPSADPGDASKGSE